MMLTRKQMEEKLSRAFPPEQTASLVEVVDDIRQAELERAADTRELRRGLTGLTEEVRKLAEAQRRTEERLERLEATVQVLAEAQRRTEEAVRELVLAQQRSEQRLEELVGWQRGEAGRREGERYERLILRRAPALFHGGQGGVTDDPSIRQRLTEKLGPLLTSRDLTDEEDPFLADLIWRRPEPVEGWKGEQFVVVEASRRVNGNDVNRAARRAETLQEADVEAMGVVIGEEWVGPDVRPQAEARSVQWKVGDDLSDGLLAFRRLSAVDVGS
ncbi:MAG: hypothetical protein ACE5F6_19190 [Anaerolineae bacterium]